jgi:hypothetical protein
MALKILAIMDHYHLVCVLKLINLFLPKLL